MVSETYRVVIDGDAASLTVHPDFIEVETSQSKNNIDMKYIKNVSLFAWRRDIEVSMGANIVTISTRKAKQLHSQIDQALTAYRSRN